MNAKHGCGLCNASPEHLIYDPESTVEDTWWVCDVCGWEHTSHDCCAD